MLGTQLALTKSLIDIFTLLDVYDEGPARDRVTRLVADLADDEEATLLGVSYGEALAVLSSDLPRWRLAGDLALRLDLHECLPALLSTLMVQPDAHQLAVAVGLASSPAVSVETEARVRSLVEQRADLVRPLPRLLRLRLDATIEPENDLEGALRAQMWPGAVAPSALRRVGPLVYISEAGVDASTFWKAAAGVAAAGARVRRLPSHWKRPVPRAWYGAHYPLVSWSGNAVAQVRQQFPGVEPKNVPVGHHEAGGQWVSRMLAAVDRALPQGVNLNRKASWTSEELRAFSPETLHLGAFDASEMSFLGAASRHTVRRLAQDALRPYNSDVNRWAFSSLVALRILQAFKSRGVALRVAPRVLLQQLDDLAAKNETHRVGIDARGVVFVERDSEYVALHSGQVAMKEAVLVDDAFSSFELGTGPSVPLLHPSKHTEVHPAVLGGTPVVSGTRLSARALNEMLLARGDAIVRSAYPELDAGQIADAARVGQRLRAINA